jgi:hypothetical protein
MKARYIAISALAGQDELYYLGVRKMKLFQQQFGPFNEPWPDHEAAIDWIRENAKFIDNCTCVS